MNLSRTLATLTAVGVMTGCAIAPSPSPADNPYYTTKPLKPYVVADAVSSTRAAPTRSPAGVVATPVRVRPQIDVRPLPQTVIVPGKTLPAAPVAVQPAAGVDVSNLKRFDANKDGVVTTQEILSDGLGRMMAFDRNNNGYLSQPEFQQAMGDRRNRFGASTNLFKHLDRNKDNRLSSQEVAGYLAPSINALDAEGTGVISDLSPIPPFPKAEQAPSPRTVVAGLPRITKPGASGSPVRATQKATKGKSVKKGARHVVKGKKVTPPRNTRASAKNKAAQKKKVVKKSVKGKKKAVTPKKSTRKTATKSKRAPK